MGLYFCFLKKSCLLLLCLRVRYLVSNLVKVLAILEMKVLSFLFCIVLTSVIILSSIGRDIRAGIVFGSKAGPDVGLWHTGVEALIDASKDVEASEVSTSKAQKVQFEIARWYLLFMNTKAATSSFSLSTSTCSVTAAATSQLSATSSSPSVSVCTDRSAVGMVRV